MPPGFTLSELTLSLTQLGHDDASTPPPVVTSNLLFNGVAFFFEPAFPYPLFED